MCRAHPEKADIESPLYVGKSGDLRKGTLQTHTKSAKHELCEEARKAKLVRAKPREEQQGPIDQGIKKMSKNQIERMTKLFNTAYHVFKLEQPFTHYTSNLKLQQKNGVDIGTQYHSDVACSR